MEHRLVLDTVNEVSRALLELVPWRAREGLDKLVSDTNERYKVVSDTVKQRVEEIDAAIQRSQQVIEQPLQGFLGERPGTAGHTGPRQREGWQAQPAGQEGQIPSGMPRNGPQQQRVAAGVVADLSWCVFLGWDNSGAALCYPACELLGDGDGVKQLLS